MCTPWVARSAGGVRGWSAVLVGLAVAAAAGEQYGGGVPQYGADYERAEYRAHDAPPALDYTFEEQDRAHGDGDRVPGYWDPHTSTREARFFTDEPEEPVQPARVGRRHRRGRRDEVRPEPLARRRPPPREAPRHSRDDYGEQEYTAERLEDEAPKLAKSTGRAARRPRERLFAPPPPVRSTTGRSTQLAAEEDEGGFRRRPAAAEGIESEPDYYSGVERAHAVPRRPTLPSTPPAPVTPPAGPTVWSGSTLPAYPEYNEYYDHKSFNSKIKPNLARRSSTGAGAPSPRLRFQTRAEQPVRPPWGGRRAERPPAPVPPAPTLPTSTPAEYSPVVFVPESNGSAPSLAEQSRLSILRKAQQGGRTGGGGGASKPPVLLQVTSRAPTVVMVQAGGGAGAAWARARDVSGDSPDTLAKVKRLMRQKLVAGAKSIRDLTDNWDDTVCDYIDVAMLQEETSAASPARPAPAALALLLYCTFQCQ